MTTTAEAPRFVKAVTCRRCSGTGFVSSRVAYWGVPGTCFKCDGRGEHEGDRATIRAAKERSERRVAAAMILHRGDLGHGDLTGAPCAEVKAAREFRAAVVWGFDSLEAREPERFVKAVDSVLAGHPTVFEALAAYGRTTTA